MALRNLEVIVAVTDKASKDLDKINNKVKGTGDAAKKATVDFTGFNRTLFATTAFVGTFIKAFSSLNKSFEAGSELDRLSNQFERVLGPKGDLFNQISNLTDASIDKFEAMRQGISLKSLGIVQSTGQVADIMAKAGVAAKLAGKDSAEGIKTYSDFLKDGSVSHLEFLNLISKSNPALQAQMAILSKAGGMMGGVISTQARLALGQSLLNAAVRGNLKGFRDLRDILLDAKQNFALFRGELGRLLLTALGPIVDKISQFVLKLSLTIDHIRKNEKNLVFLTRAVLISTAAVLGLAGALGTLRLATIALASIGLGLPRLLVLITTLGSAFLGITHSADSFIDRLKIFAGFIKGVWQLVTSLNKKTGIAQIDEDLKNLLEKNGIFVFAQNVARVVSVIKTVVEDMVDAFRFAARTIDNIFGGVVRSFINIIEKFKQPWENFWVSESATPVEKFVRSFAVLGTTFGAIFTGIFLKSIFGKLTGGLLSKIPVIGKLFGGKGGGPKGTKSDPIYTRVADGLAGGLLNKMGLGEGSALAGIFDLFSQTLKQSGLMAAIKEIGTLFGLFSQQVGGLMGVFRAVTSVVTDVIAPLAVFGSAIYGSLQGIFATMDEWKSFFNGIFDLGKAISDVVLNFIENNKYLKAVKDALVSTVDGIYKAAKFVLVDGPLQLMKLIAEGWQNIFGWLGIGAGSLGKKMTDLAKTISPQTFSPVPTDINPQADKETNNAGIGGDKTNISIPDTTTNSDDTINMLGEHLKTLSGSQRKMTQQTIQDALRSDSEGGSVITADEMAKIMQDSTSGQLGVLQRIEQNTRSTQSTGAVANRRGL